MSLRPLRSVLFMPGSNQRALDKARSLPADAIIFDLEDAVAPDNKDSAREAVAAQVRAGGYGKRLLVARCNALATPWGRDDLHTLAATPLQILCLPKVESSQQLDAVSAELLAAGRDDLHLWAMLETPAGVQAAEAIAAHPAVAALVMGTTDLASTLRVPQRADRLGLQYALGHCLLAARRFDTVILDGVHLDLDDASGFRAICEQGRALGFDGKTLIHPRQIDAANAVFGPSEAALEWARRVLAAWEEAEDEGRGLAVLDGKLVETMHVDEARRTLQTARLIAELAVE